MTDEQKNTYLSIASQHGAGAATDYWDTIKKSDGHDRNAYALRDTAYRSFARERPVLSSAATIATSPMSIAGTLYSFGQKILGKEIDPYADSFMFGQATSAIRDQVGAEITRRYGNTDGTDNLASWLMRMGYNAAMSGADSLLAGKLGGTVMAGHQKGAALLGSLMQGAGGAGSMIQDIKLRGGSDEQALMMGGLSILFETATEYLPMDQLLKTADAKDITSFRQLAVSAFKGGLAEAPGEGLSELLGGISDQLIMGELSNYEQKWRDYRAGGLSEEAAKQKAIVDILWGVCEASFTGFLSGEGSNLIAGAGGYLRNHGKQLPSGQQAAPGADVMPWVDMPGLPGMPEGMAMPESEASVPEEMVVSETEAGVPEGVMLPETEAGMPEGAMLLETEAGLPEGMVLPESEAGLPEEAVLPETEAGVTEGMVVSEQAEDPSAPHLQTEADGETKNPDALHDGQMPGQTEEAAMSDGTIPEQQEQLTDGTTAVEPDVQQTDGTTVVEPDVQLTDGQMPTQQAYYDSREEVGKRFRERAKPLVDQTRDLWQRIQRIEDPVTRTLKELAYMQLFRPMWEDSINEQYYIDYPHRRPDPEVENRKVQERLANVPPVILQAAYDMVQGQPWYGAGQQWYGNMQVVPSISQQSGEMNEAVNGDVYSPMHPANSGIAGENKNNYTILSTRAMVTPDEGEMKPLHEWVVSHSLYEGNPEVAKKDKLSALKNDETFQKAHLNAAETIEKHRENGIIALGKTTHASERMRERAVTDDDVHDTLTNPIHSKGIVTDNLGRKSQILIGKNATVCVNPDTGNVITAWKTGSKTRKKYTGGD